EIQAIGEQLLLERLTTPAGNAIRLQLYRREHAVTANIGDYRSALQRKDRVEKIRRQRTAAFEQPFVLVDVERGESRCARTRMTRIRIAVQEFDGAFRRGGH